MAFSDFVIAPSPQLKLNPYSVNEHRATQWSLITQPSMRLPFSVTIADHHPRARWHRWQGLIGLTDRCQVPWHVLANTDKREKCIDYPAEFLLDDWSDDPILWTGAKLIFHAHWALCTEHTFLMDIIVLWRGHLLHVGIAWHISNDFTSQLIAVHRKSGMPLKTCVCESWLYITSWII